MPLLDRRVSLALTIGSALASFAAAALAHNVAISAIAFIATLLSAVLQYRLGQPFIKRVTEADWTETESGYNIAVPLDEHKHGAHPTATFYLPSEGGGEEEAFLDKHVAKDGTLTISVARPVAGTLKIR